MTREADVSVDVIVPPSVGEQPERASRPPDENALLAAVLAEREVWPVLAPIIELQTGAPAGYEALTRGPFGPLREPDPLNAAALRCGRVAELDALCRERALEAAQQAGMRPPMVLFVNVDPAAVGSAAAQPVPPGVLTLMHQQGVQVIAEIPEQALADDPAGVLAYADRVRAWGCGIGLDGVGARRDALPLVPLLRPDVVKLDLGAIDECPGEQVAATMTAISAYAEAHDAVVVAEGVETSTQEQTALALGATHAQGGRFGPPIPAGEEVLSRSALWQPIVPRVEYPHSRRDSGFALLARGHPRRVGPKRLLLQTARHIEQQAADMGGVVVLASVQDDRHLNAVTRRRFEAMAEHATFVAVVGADVTGEPADGVRGGHIATSDPLYWEWDLVVVGPHYGVALAARDQGDTGPELDRRFDYVLTYDRPTVLALARLLFSRLGPR